MSKRNVAEVDHAKSESFVSLVEECQKARREFEQSEVEYLLFVRTIERDRASVWMSVYPSFEEFLVNAVLRPEPSRYRNFVAVVEKMGEPKLRAMGLDACVEQLKLYESAPAKVSAYERAVKAWGNEHGGAHPSGRYARQLRQQVAPAEVMPNPVRRLEELEHLRVENAELRRECERLKKEVGKLKGELEVARKPIAKGAKSKGV